MNMSDIGVSTAWKMLIQPERINYSMENLGPNLTCFQSRDCYRKDFTFKNSRQNEICVSLFFPIPPNSDHTNLESLTLNVPCVVYCHSQSGNRIEGSFLQEWCIENNYGLCLFDFNGCGKSGGEYVTLGWKEHDDLEVLINILTKEYRATQIALWGRSMGAVTSIMYAKRHSLYLSAMILDSPFSDISVMVKDVAYEHLKIPGLIVSMALRLMSSTVKDKVHFDILKLKPAEFAKTCTVPCVFIIGKEDKLVLPKRVQEIFDAYVGKQKVIITSEGGHSDEREPHILNQCFKLLFQEIQKNSYVPRATLQTTPEYVDTIPDDYLATLTNEFSNRLTSNIRSSNQKNGINKPYNINNGKPFNFDYNIEDERKDSMPLIQDSNHFASNTSKHNYKPRYNDYTMDNTLDKSEQQINPLKDYGDISAMDLEKNIKDISMVMRNQRL